MKIKIGTSINPTAETFGDTTYLGLKATEDIIEKVISHERMHSILGKMRINIFYHHAIIKRMSE